jgi:hypothetical protein
MIVIFAPYGRNEVTAAAIRLADLAMALGDDTCFVATGDCERGIHGFWDPKVVSGRFSTAVYKAARYADHCVWFIHDGRLRRAVDLVATKAVHTLVPLWHHLYLRGKDALTSYQHIVCPSKACHEAIRTFLGKDSAAARIVTWARWDSGLAPTARNGLLNDEQVRVCIFAEHSSIDKYASLMLAITNALLENGQRHRVTILSTKSWPARARATLDCLRRRYKERLCFKRATAILSQMREFHDHDWVYLPATKADFAITAAAANACGAPTIVNNVAPFNEVITPRHSGVWLSHEREANWLGAEVALPHKAVPGIVAQVVATVDDVNLLLAMQRLDWHVAENQRAFIAFWRRLWGQDAD